MIRTPAWGGAMLPALVVLASCSSSGMLPGPADSANARPTPPPLDTTVPGAVRLKPTSPSQPGIPPLPVTVRLDNGLTVSLVYGDTCAADGGPAATVNVAREPGNLDARSLRVHEGDVRTLGDVVLHVVHIWPIPTYAYCAVDVQVAPSP